MTLLFPTNDAHCEIDLWNIPFVYIDPQEVLTTEQETLFCSYPPHDCDIDLLLQPVLHREGFILLGSWNIYTLDSSLQYSSLTLLFQLEQAFLCGIEGLRAHPFNRASQSRTVIHLQSSPIKHLNSASIFTRVRDRNGYNLVYISEKHEINLSHWHFCFFFLIDSDR